MFMTAIPVPVMIAEILSISIWTRTHVVRIVYYFGKLSWLTITRWLHTAPPSPVERPRHAIDYERRARDRCLVEVLPRPNTGEDFGRYNVEFSNRPASADPMVKSCLKSKRQNAQPRAWW